MSYNKILSVSIAAYNVQNTLPEALESFVDEKWIDKVDVMIIDDGSSDSTPEIAKNFIDKYPNSFRLIKKENGGWGSTLNVGINNAHGTYFKQLDGDDFFSKDNLASFIDVLSHCTADMVYSPFVTFQDKTNAILSILGTYQGSYRFFPIGKTIPITYCENFMPAMHSLTVRTDLLRQNKISILEHCFYTDLEFVLKCYNICNTVHFFEKPIYYYRLARNGQSMSISGVRKHYLEHQKVLFHMLEYLNQSVSDPFKQKHISERLFCACYLQYTFYYALACSSDDRQNFKSFDNQLKECYPELFSKMCGLRIRILRKLNFHGYRIFAHQKMLHDKRLKINLYEGY